MMKAWMKPELTVVRRGTSQEAVLATCKGKDLTTRDSIVNRASCQHSLYYLCQDCKDVSTS